MPLLGIQFLIILLVLSPTPFYGQDTDQLPPWEEGILDIHHISTGRGNATFLIFPDGTTLLIDAGDMSESHARTISDRNVPLLPNRKKSTGGWLLDYIERFHPNNIQLQLDYALLTHFHDDHFGEVDNSRAFSNTGKYQLTGITEVGDVIPIRTLIDRGFQFPVDLTDSIIQREMVKGDSYHMIATLKNYWNFLDYQARTRGLKREILIPGALNQISLKYKKESYPEVSIRNICANGEIWTGVKEETFQVFHSGEYPGENPLSTGIKIMYGLFDYFSGGDLSGVDANGNSDFDSMESQIAPVVGEVDIACLNHHGNRDSQNTFYVRTLRPRIWIGHTWSSDHPDNNVLRRLLSENLYPGKRDLFATAMLPSTKSVIGALTEGYASKEGHVVVRVMPGGSNYVIFVLNSLTEEREILKKFGPYESK